MRPELTLSANANALAESLRACISRRRSLPAWTGFIVSFSSMIIDDLDVHRRPSRPSPSGEKVVGEADRMRIARMPSPQSSPKW